MTQVVKPTSVPTKRLSVSITPSDTTFRVSDILGWDGSALTSASFGDQAYGCFRDASGTILELFEFDPTTIASTNITLLKRGLNFTGDRTTQVTANKLTWVKGTTLVELGTSAPAFFQWLKEYIDAAAIAGGVPATTSVQGIVKMSVAPVSAANPIAVSDNDTRLPSNTYAVDTGSVNAFAISISSTLAAYATGQMFLFKSANANTGTCTLNVNSLGAKTIKKGGSTNLASGDIASGQIVAVVYDGTNMQLVSKTAPTQTVVTGVTFATGTSSKNLADATASTTVIAHGLGIAPKKVTLRTAYIPNAQTSISVVADGSWFNGSYSSRALFISEGGSTAVIDTADLSTSYALLMWNEHLSGGVPDYYQTATIAVDATNITITWAKTGSPTGTNSFIWEAEAYTTVTIPV